MEQLALFIAHIRENGLLVHALARFVLQIQINRRNCLRQLNKFFESNKRALAARLDFVKICVDLIWNLLSLYVLIALREKGILNFQINIPFFRTGAFDKL